jgi:hypothetical protein
MRYPWLLFLIIAFPILREVQTQLGMANISPELSNDTVWELLKKSIKLGAELLPACTIILIIIHHTVPEDDVAAAAVTAAEFQLFAIGIIIITLSTSSSFYAAATTTTTTITVPS